VDGCCDAEYESKRAARQRLKDTVSSKKPPKNVRIAIIKARNLKMDSEDGEMDVEITRAESFLRLSTANEGVF